MGKRPSKVATLCPSCHFVTGKGPILAVEECSSCKELKILWKSEDELEGLIHELRKFLDREDLAWWNVNTIEVWTTYNELQAIINKYDPGYNVENEDN